MNDTERLHYFVEKLKTGLRFGLFNDHSKCYFEDGEHISYTDLWKALKEIHQIQIGEHKTLTELCPDTFAGSYQYRFQAHNWKKKQAVK